MLPFFAFAAVTLVVFLGLQRREGDLSRVVRPLRLICGTLAVIAVAMVGSVKLTANAIEKQPTAADRLVAKFAVEEEELKLRNAETLRLQRIENEKIIAKSAQTVASINRMLDERREAARPARYQAMRQLRFLGDGSVVTKSDFDNAQLGVSYGSLSYDIGADGVLVSESRAANLPVVMIYQWQNGDGSVLMATFQADKLVGKSQVGLK